LVHHLKLEIMIALKTRFEGLPVHKMLYYQSYNNMTVGQLNDAVNMRSRYNMRERSSRLDTTGNLQDTLGMTALHILACSTMQNIDMYRIIIDKYPDNLITKDKWGEIPLLYAIWGQAPDEIVCLLIDSITDKYSDYDLEWEKMFETLAKSDARWDVLAGISDFSSEYWQWVDWYGLMNKLADSTSFETPGSITPNSFHYLFAKAFLPRLEKLSVWFKVFINEAMTYEKALACADKKAHLNELLSELEEYENKFQGMENATTQLELALWNMKIEEGLQMKKRHRKAKKYSISRNQLFRNECRVNCGANIIIPLVMSYLFPAGNS